MGELEGQETSTKTEAKENSLSSELAAFEREVTGTVEPTAQETVKAEPEREPEPATEAQSAEPVKTTIETTQAEPGKRASEPRRYKLPDGRTMTAAEMEEAGFLDLALTHTHQVGAYQKLYEAEKQRREALETAGGAAKPAADQGKQPGAGERARMKPADLEVLDKTISQVAEAGWIDPEFPEMFQQTARYFTYEFVNARTQLAELRRRLDEVQGTVAPIQHQRAQQTAGEIVDRIARDTLSRFPSCTGLENPETARKFMVKMAPAFANIDHENMTDADYQYIATLFMGYRAVDPDGQATSPERSTAAALAGGARSGGGTARRASGSRNDELAAFEREFAQGQRS